MEVLQLDGSKSGSLLDGIGMEKALDLIEKTDETLVKKRKNMPREHGSAGSRINTAQVKGELAGYAYPMSDEEKLRVVRQHAAMWESFFNHDIYRDGVGVGDVDSVPMHPWMQLKEARSEMGGAESLSCDERYALRFVKTFYAEKWRSLG